jgi:hypothetical protein
MKKLNVNIDISGFKWAGIVQGDSSEALVLDAKQQATPIIAGKLPWPMNGIAKKKLSKMSALDFAREVVSRYNAAYKTTFPTPLNCDEFIMWASARGFTS